MFYVMLKKLRLNCIANQKLYALVMLALLPVSNNLGQRASRSQIIACVFQLQNTEAFSKAAELPKSALLSDFKFFISERDYKIASNGRGERIVGNNHLSFNLHVDKHFSLEHIYYAKYRRDILLLCEISNEVSGAGFITRLDGRTLQAKWKKTVPSFNVGQGLIEGRYVYLTAIGFVAKLDLNSGAYVWRHADLYENTFRYDSFALPEVEGDAVLFRDKGLMATLKINKHSGKIISINK